MLGFCDNFIDRSLVLILKYTVCEFYDCNDSFWRNENILNSNKKKKKNCWNCFLEKHLLNQKHFFE